MRRRCLDDRARREPYYDHIARKTFSDFTHEEVGVRVTHANADNGHRYTIVPAGYGRKAALGAEREWPRGNIKDGRNPLRAGG